MIHQLFHSPFKPVNSSTQLSSLSHQESEEPLSQTSHHGTTTDSCHHHPLSPLITKAKYLCRLCGLQGTANRFSSVAQKNTHLLHLFPSNHHCQDRLSLPTSLGSCLSSPLHPKHTTCPQHKQEKTVEWCLENGIRSKIFLLIRHRSGRVLSGALDLEGCHGVY